MILLRALLIAFVASTAAQAALIDFPTDNRALLDGRSEDFFMYVERDFEGEKTQPWEGGAFGFVRGPIRTGQGVVMATLHEGVDIRPVRRDPAGNPLDDIRAVANGVVVHVSARAGASNYGRYVVLEHRLGGSPIYTLYAHLATISVTPGQTVKQGETIARMGYTGAGIDRTRAHLHFEVALLLNRNFQGWYDAFQGANPNVHGLFNGMNLIGTDPAAVLVSAAKDPTFDLSRHISSVEPYFKVTVRNTPGLTILRDYPWLVPAGQNANPVAWTISFSASGVPVRAVASSVPVAEPRVEWVRDSPVAYSHATRGIIGGSAGNPRLTESGMRFMRLLTWPDGAPVSGRTFLSQVES
jgi:murein DD-endopeptidase MepM/ murein hydrolase activator NlpD